VYNTPGRHRPRRRAIQYPRDSDAKSRGRGVLDRPVKPGDDERRKSRKLSGTMDASRSLSPGTHSRNPLARNDGCWSELLFEK
jgi:hypothetical protein